MLFEKKMKTRFQSPGILNDLDKFFASRPNQINDELLLLKILNFSNLIFEKGVANVEFRKVLQL